MIATARDFLHVTSNPNNGRRMLTTTPWAIALDIAHRRIEYGEIISEAHGGEVLRMLKRAIFLASRDAITECSQAPARCHVVVGR